MGGCLTRDGGTGTSLFAGVPTGSSARSGKVGQRSSNEDSGKDTVPSGPALVLLPPPSGAATESAATDGGDTATGAHQLPTHAQNPSSDFSQSIDRVAGGRNEHEQQEHSNNAAVATGGDEGGGGGGGVRDEGGEGDGGGGRSVASDSEEEEEENSGGSESSRSSSSSSTADNVADSESDNSEDDTAELTESRAREIAQQTAAVSVVHSIPPRRVRGILSTSNSFRGLPRPLSSAALAQRKKGLRWNVNGESGSWSTQLAPLQPITSTTRKRRPSGIAPPGFVNSSAAAAGPPSPAASDASGAPSSRRDRMAAAGGNTAGEKWTGHHHRKRNSESVDSPMSHSVGSAAVAADSAGAIVAPAAGMPSSLSNSPAAPAAAPSSVSAAPRQYTSSARVAGSSSFKARAQGGSSSSLITDSPLSLATSSSGIGMGGGAALSLSSTTNLLLKLSPVQLERLEPAALQQLFLLYSKAARNVRDKLAQQDRSGTGSARKGSNHLGFSLSNPPLTAAQSFLLAAGVEPHGPTPSASSWSQAAYFCELGPDVCLSVEETLVLALHLVQRKLAAYAAELAQRPEMSNVAGPAAAARQQQQPQAQAAAQKKAKLASLLKVGRWSLFPGAMALPAAELMTTGADAAAAATAAVNAALIVHTAAASASPSPTPSPQPSPSSSASPAASQFDKAFGPPSSASTLTEAQVTDWFVRCTASLLCARLRTNNFGEMVWAGWIDAKWTPASRQGVNNPAIPAGMTHLSAAAAAASATPSSDSNRNKGGSKANSSGSNGSNNTVGAAVVANSWSRFVSFFLSYHAVLNPEGLSPQELEQCNKRKARDTKAARCITM